MPSTRLKSLLRWLGMALAIAALLFVGQRFWELSGALPEGLLRDAWPWILVASLLYASVGGLLGVSWWLLLRASGASSAPLLGSAAAYFASQVGKYLPGNVGHFAARHIFGRRHGASHGQLMTATAIEMALLSLASAMFALLVVPQLLQALLPDQSFHLAIRWGVAALMVVVASVVIALIWWRRDLPGASSRGRVALQLGASYALCTAFFIGCTLCFVVMSPSVQPSLWTQLLPWLAAAWLLGFVIPGAPGGLGIRELVLTVGLAPILGEAQALVDALLFRAVTVGGDVLMSLSGTAYLRAVAGDALSREGSS